MDNVMAVEESRSDLVACAPKSVGSIVQIDSISIDISCAMEEIDLKEHDHFSIRKFVVGMSEKNQKTSMPFGTEGDEHHVMDNLPPLSIPKFRWWKCSTCVSDITAGQTTPEKQLVVRNNAGINSHPNADKETDDLLSCDIRQTGDGNQSSHGEEVDICNKMIVCSPQCTAEHEVICSRAQTNIMDDDDEGGNASIQVVEAIPLQIMERDPNAAVENPSIRESENASSGSDGRGVNAAQRRRRKLRSLVDIMDDDKNSTSEKSRKGSTDAETDLEPQLLLDVPTEISEGIKSRQRKKKSVHKEDRGQLEPSNPGSASKRLKNLIVSLDKKSTREQIIDLESEGGASGLLDLRENAKTPEIKTPKNKSLDTSRKSKQMHIDRRTVPTREVPQANEVEHHFMGILSGQQMDRISKPSKGKEPVSESRYSPSLHTIKSSLKDHNIPRELALDLSLNSYVRIGTKSNNDVSSRQHTGIPDLNKSFPEKVPVMQGKELPTLSEKRSATLLGRLETFAPCSKVAIFPQPQAVKNADNNVEPREPPPDDIPMDIVELMAKNQCERALGNSKQQPAPARINKSVRGSSPFYVDRPPIVNFPFTYTRGNMAADHGISNFPREENFQLGAGNLFSSFKACQQYPASRLGRRPNEGADMFWPPRQMNVPFHPSVSENYSVQHHPLNLQSFPDHRYKRKSTVSCAKGNEKNTELIASADNKGRLESSSKSVRSVDKYCNDTIPAMQLLSLMHQGITSSSSCKMGPTHFHDKHLSTSPQHSQMIANGNQNDPFLNVSNFSLSHSPGITKMINSISHLQGQTVPKQGSVGTTTSWATNDLEFGVCTLSRNPADFSTPDEGNEFTISCKDLKSRRRNDCKERTRPDNADGQKKQKARKSSRK